MSPRSWGCVETKVVVAGCVSTGLEESAVDNDSVRVGIFHFQCAVPNGIELLPGKNGFGAYGAVFLADDAGLVHRPRQAAAAIQKGGTEPYRSLAGELAFTVFLVEGYRPDGAGGADVSAGDAVVLAAAGAGAIV